MTPLKFSQHVGRDFLPSVFLGGEGRERAVRQTAAEIREAHLLMLSKISLAERSTFVTRRCLELWVISDSVNHQEKNQAGQKNATKRVRNDHARAREPPEGERERERERDESHGQPQSPMCTLWTVAVFSLPANFLVMRPV